VTVEAEAEREIVELTEPKHGYGMEESRSCERLIWCEHPWAWEAALELAELMRIQAKSTEEGRVLNELTATLELEVGTNCSYSVEVTIAIGTNDSGKDSHIKVIHTFSKE